MAGHEMINHPQTSAFLCTYREMNRFDLSSSKTAFQKNFQTSPETETKHLENTCPQSTQTKALPINFAGGSHVPPKTRMKILIIGHTFVRQLFDSQKCFSFNADILLDGLYGATVDQVAKRVYSIQKNPPQFDAVIIHIGCFDLLDRASVRPFGNC